MRVVWPLPPNRETNQVDAGFLDPSYPAARKKMGLPPLRSITKDALLPLAFTTYPAAITHYLNTGTTLPSTAPTTGYTASETRFPLVLLTITS